MERQFATFFIGGARFGIDILMVREINRHLDITPAERAPDFVRGLLNLRGQVVTVIDLATRLGIGRCEIGPESCCMVLKTAAELSAHQEAGLLDDTTLTDVVGLLIDRIGDMVTVGGHNMEPPPANLSGVDGKFLAGIAKLEDGLVGALRACEVLDAEAA